MTTYTIGFTQKSAERFFTLLRGAGVTTVIDVRLNNSSQLAGFAKRNDLAFFLQELCQVDYLALPELAPTKLMLSAYRSGSMRWEDYEQRFFDLMTQRQIEKVLKPAMFEGGCLLCSEHKPHQCHRRLVVEYLSEQWGSPLTVEHLY